MCDRTCVLQCALCKRTCAELCVILSEAWDQTYVCAQARAVHVRPDVCVAMCSVQTDVCRVVCDIV